MDQGAAEIGALLHAARELVGRVAGELVEPDRAQERHARARRAARACARKRAALRARRPRAAAARCRASCARAAGSRSGRPCRCRCAGRRPPRRRPRHAPARRRHQARRPASAATTCRSPRGRPGPRTRRARPASEQPATASVAAIGERRPRRGRRTRAPRSIRLRLPQFVRSRSSAGGRNASVQMSATAGVARQVERRGELVDRARHARLVDRRRSRSPARTASGCSARSPCRAAACSSSLSISGSYLGDQLDRAGADPRSRP